MERIFKIRMHVPLGYRDGTLSFTKKDDQKIEGALCLFQNETTFRGKLADDGEITFAGQMVTLTRTFLYQAHGRVDGTKIRLHVSGDRNTFSITGEEGTL